LAISNEINGLLAIPALFASPEPGDRLPPPSFDFSGYHDS
jgi:hypothetical protein